MVAVTEAAAVEMEETRGREIFYAGRIHIDFACGGPSKSRRLSSLLLGERTRRLLVGIMSCGGDCAVISLGWNKVVLGREQVACHVFSLLLRQHIHPRSNYSCVRGTTRLHCPSAAASSCPGCRLSSSSLSAGGWWIFV